MGSALIHIIVHFGTHELIWGNSAVLGTRAFFIKREGHSFRKSFTNPVSLVCHQQNTILYEWLFSCVLFKTFACWCHLTTWSPSIHYCQTAHPSQRLTGRDLSRTCIVTSCHDRLSAIKTRCCCRFSRQPAMFAEEKSAPKRKVNVIKIMSIYGGESKASMWVALFLSMTSIPL